MHQIKILKTNVTINECIMNACKKIMLANFYILIEQERTSPIPVSKQGPNLLARDQSDDEEDDK